MKNIHPINSPRFKHLIALSWGLPQPTRIIGSYWWKAGGHGDNHDETLDYNTLEYIHSKGLNLPQGQKRKIRKIPEY